MSETYKINNTVLTFNHLIYVAVDGSDENGDGSQGRPFASFEKAETIAVDGDAVVFGKGAFELQPYTGPITRLTACFFGSKKSISIIGQGHETVIYANVEKYHPERDEPLFQGKITNVYRLNIKYAPYSMTNYENAIFEYGAISLHNVAIENISATNIMSVNYWNGGTGGSLFNCVIKSNGRYAADYSGKLIAVKDTLFDWDYKNSSVFTNKLVRTITNDDIEYGTAADLENVGVWAGEFAWKKNGKRLYMDEHNVVYGVK